MSRELSAPLVRLTTQSRVKGISNELKKGPTLLSHASMSRPRNRKTRMHSQL